MNLFTMFGGRTKSTVSANGTGRIVVVNQEPVPSIDGKVRVPQLGAFSDLAGWSEWESKVYRKSVLRANLFYYSTRLFGFLPWSLDGPNEFDNTQMTRGTKINELPLNAQATLKNLLAECPHRFEELLKRKMDGQGNGPSATMNNYFIQLYAELFNKHLPEVVTVNHLLYACVTEQFPVQEIADGI